MRENVGDSNRSEQQEPKRGSGAQYEISEQLSRETDRTNGSSVATVGSETRRRAVYWSFIRNIRKQRRWEGK